MIDTSGHHIVYGELRDYLTGEALPDTDDERVRQDLARLLVERLGYDRGELEPRLTIDTCYNGNRTRTLIELAVRIDGRRLFIVRYGPGSLVTREKAAVAAARLLDPAYRIPLAVVTNGRDAELLETAWGRVLATGMACIPERSRAASLAAACVFEPFADPVRRDQALRILNVFDREVCCLGSACRQENGTDTKTGVAADGRRNRSTINPHPT
ncbi:MAG: type I restriction enzyme HsdR N-terminal domain-containing protein [Proteobacteria bacterium]|nr:type I restriction enzyme HsdR N-terminal domain-containing protein [Pseudomonadota bacterium]